MRGWTVVSGATIFVAALVTVIAFFDLPNSPEAGSAGSASGQQLPSAEAESEDPSAPAGITATESDVRPGSNCLSAGGDAVTCDGPHSYEVVEVSTGCSAPALLSYLGGDEDVDVLRPGSGSSVVQISGKPACTVTAPAGGALTLPAQDALRGSAGDAWRWCLSQEDDASIGCSTPHDREVIGPSGAQVGPLDCAARADRYLEVPLRNHDRQLYVTSEQVDGAQRCVVGVRGDNRLNASLRRLRSSSLPITAS